MSRIRLHDINPEAIADGTYGVTVVAGVITGLAEIQTVTYVPLTTTVGGAPEEVWDGNDEIVLTEASL